MDKIARAEAANRIVNDDAFRNAVSDVYNGIVEQMTAISATDETVLEARRELIALKKIEARLKSYIATGRIEQEKRDRGSDR